jgi:hypothetical protein
VDDSADIAARTRRFNEAVRAFTPASPTRHAKLMPLKDGIVELRQKGASLRLIRELLATVDVAVSTDTIARFLAEVNGEPASGRLSKRSPRRRAAVAASTAPQMPTPPLLPAAETALPPIERSRTRGPRIADPRNL